MVKIGLVLSGGMAKGAYQIGALQAINEVFKPSDISYASAASVGAINTYLYLTEGLDKGEKLWNNINNEHARPWVTTVLRSSFLQNAIKSIVIKEEIKNNFYIPLLNMKKRTLTYMNLKRMPGEHMEDCLRASIAMPIYNSAVNINGDSFYDGALIDNIPINPILKFPVDYLICIYFDQYNYTFESEHFNNKVIKMNFSDDSSLSNSILFKGDSIKQMIDDGYKKAKRILDYVFINGIEDTESIYLRIADLNEMNADRHLRITGDIVVSNMNKVTKKFMRRLEIR